MTSHNFYGSLHNNTAAIDALTSDEVPEDREISIDNCLGVLTTRHLTAHFLNRLQVEEAPQGNYDPKTQQM